MMYFIGSWIEQTHDIFASAEGTDDAFAGAKTASTMMAASPATVTPARCLSAFVEDRIVKPGQHAFSMFAPSPPPLNGRWEGGKRFR